NKNEKQIGELTSLFVSDYRSFANKNYNTSVDRKVAKAMIAEYVRLVPREKQPAIFSDLHTVFAGDVNRFVDNIFENSVFGNEAKLERFLSSPSAEALIQDPMFAFARSVKEEEISLRDQQDAFTRSYLIARRSYLKGVL